MALEPITRQEQIIAGKDLEPITRMEKFLKEYGGGGGASSWNDLDDRPFGEETVYGDTLTWDGNTEGKTVLGEVFVKISDETPTLAELINGVVSVGGETVTISEDMIDNSSDNVVNVMSMIYVVSVAGANMYGEVVFPEVGIYTVLENGALSLTINGYNGFETKVVKQLDNKYLEPFVTVGGDTLTWDGNTSGMSSPNGTHYKVSDNAPTLEDFAGGFEFVVGGETANVPDNTGFTQLAPTFLEFDGGLFWIVSEDTDAGGGTIVAKGTYFLNSGEFAVTSLKINGYTGFTTTKLKEEYIPVDYIKQLIAEVTGN